MRIGNWNPSTSKLVRGSMVSPTAPCMSPCRSSKKQGFGHCPVLSRHGDGVNGPSRTKIEEMARFVYKLEKMQEARP
jgi:hypothetical protein